MDSASGAGAGVEMRVHEVRHATIRRGDRGTHGLEQGCQWRHFGGRRPRPDERVTAVAGGPSKLDEGA